MNSPAPPEMIRIGVDIGGTKMEIAAIDESGAELLRRRESAPRGSYAEAIEAIAQFVLEAERDVGARCSVGIGTPGAVSRRSGVLKNAYASALNGMPVGPDLERRLGREVRFANDANCFALSETIDGAAKGASVVFGVILGTGVGGGVVADGRAIEGANSIAGEWGHNTLPWPIPGELPGPRCGCGRDGCIEAFLSGPEPSCRDPGSPAITCSRRESRASRPTSRRAPNRVIAAARSRSSATRSGSRARSRASSICSIRRSSCSAAGCRTPIACTATCPRAGAVTSTRTPS